MTTHSIPRLVPSVEEFVSMLDPKSPLGILLAQDDYIREATGGRVSVLVCLDKVDSGFRSYTFVFHSNVTSFRVAMFTFHVGVAMNYPVRISFLKGEGNRNMTLDLNSEEEFVTSVRQFLCSSDSLATIRNLST